MTLGTETDESRQQWAADMDTEVSHLMIVTSLRGFAAAQPLR